MLDVITQMTVPLYTSYTFCDFEEVRYSMAYGSTMFLTLGTGQMQRNLSPDM